MNKRCKRCCCLSDRFYDGLCWRCDWELMNGYDKDELPEDISMRREEEDYEDDPVNNSPPSWYNQGG